MSNKLQECTKKHAKSPIFLPIFPALNSCDISSLPGVCSAHQVPGSL